MRLDVTAWMRLDVTAWMRLDVTVVNLRSTYIPVVTRCPGYEGHLLSLLVILYRSHLSICLAIFPNPGATCHSVTTIGAMHLSVLNNKACDHVSYAGRKKDKQEAAAGASLLTK